MAGGDNEEDDSSKTEDPTQKKRDDAREQGNLPISRDFSTWVLLLGLVFSLTFLLPTVVPQMLNPLTAALANAGEVDIRIGNFGGVMSRFLGAAFLPVFAVIFLLLFFAIAGWMLQTGPVFNMGLLQPKWERLSPIAGIKKLFSVNSLVELIKSIVKLILIGWVAYLFLRTDFYKSQMMTGLDNAGMVKMIFDLSKEIIFAIFLSFTLVMIIDVIYQRFTHFKGLRMTKSQVKEEYRQSEGDPHVKARLKSIRNEKARRRMMSAVPDADVIVTNPTHYAVALKYNPAKMQAPMVLAKGQDFIALKIREVAEAHKIPIVSNPPLARTLYASVEIDEEVPPQHYRAVAEVISFVYRLRKSIR
jgi:flagellar biosynthetic protein FlhB